MMRTVPRSTMLRSASAWPVRSSPTLILQGAGTLDSAILHNLASLWIGRRLGLDPTAVACASFGASTWAPLDDGFCFSYSVLVRYPGVLSHNAS